MRDNQNTHRSLLLHSRRSPVARPAASRPPATAATMEGLEGRVLYSASAPTTTVSAMKRVRTSLPDASSVTLTRADGATRSIVGRRDTWIIVHGLRSNKDAEGIKVLAAAVDAASSRDQVLLADWRKLAYVSKDGRVEEANAQATANALAAQIAKLGLPAERVNLIGFSMGGLVVARLAGALHARGGVNSIIALDPSSPKIDEGTANEHRAALDLAADSRYAIAFHGVDHGSPIERALTADDTIRIDNIGDTPEARHAGVFDVFTNMTKINNRADADPVSAVFSLGRIKAADMPRWKKDRYDRIEDLGGYEAVIAAKGVPGTLSPDVLKYVNRAGHTRRTYSS